MHCLGLLYYIERNKATHVVDLRRQEHEDLIKRAYLNRMKAQVNMLKHQHSEFNKLKLDMRSDDTVPSLADIDNLQSPEERARYAKQIYESFSPSQIRIAFQQRFREILEMKLPDVTLEDQVSIDQLDETVAHAMRKYVLELDRQRQELEARVAEAKQKVQDELARLRSELSPQE